MITIIHGENTGVSRKQFIEMKHHAKEPLMLVGSTMTVTDIAQALEGQGLFDEQKDIFIEELFSKRKQNSDTQAIITYIQNHQRNHTITVWESKDLTAGQLKQFPKAVVRKIDFPKILFSFLDSLLPGNSQQTLTLFHQTLASEEAEFIFFMVVRHIRILLALSDQSEEHIDEIRRLAPWQRGKLAKQMQRFGEKKLLLVYHRLFLIENKLKTGTLSFSLIQAIDFLLADL